MDLRRFLVTAAGVVMAGALAAPPASAASCADADSPAASAQQDPAAFTGAVVCLLNQERAKRRMHRLSSQAQLARAATDHSESMRQQGFFDHNEPNGESFLDRIRQTGYFAGARSWGAGENIGWGIGAEGSPRFLVEAWMESSEHRANILNRRFRNVGIGLAPGSPFNGADRNAVTITADFGFSKR